MKYSFIATFLILVISDVQSNKILKVEVQDFKALSDGLKVISQEIIVEHRAIINLISIDSSLKTDCFHDSFLKILSEGLKFKIRLQLIDIMKNVDLNTS